MINRGTLTSMHVAQSIVPSGEHRQPNLGGSAPNDGAA
jgi:hypothetical protein